MRKGAFSGHFSTATCSSTRSSGWVTDMMRPAPRAQARCASDLRPACAAAPCARQALRAPASRASPDVFNDTPAQRTLGFVRRASSRFRSIACVERRQRIVFQAQNGVAAFLVTQHDDVGLRPMQQPERDTRVRRMKQRALAFDDVPVIVVGIGTQQLGRTGHEVRDDCVERNSSARDQDSGLAGRAKVRVLPAAAEFARQHQCGVLLAERAVGADGEQTLAGALAAGRDRNARRRATYVDEAAAETSCGGVELAIVGRGAHACR